MRYREGEGKLKRERVSVRERWTGTELAEKGRPIDTLPLLVYLMSALWFAGRIDLLVVLSHASI